MKGKLSTLESTKPARQVNIRRILFGTVPTHVVVEFLCTSCDICRFIMTLPSGCLYAKLHMVLAIFDCKTLVKLILIISSGKLSDAGNKLKGSTTGKQPRFQYAFLSCSSTILIAIVTNVSQYVRPLQCIQICACFSSTLTFISNHF